MGILGIKTLRGRFPAPELSALWKRFQKTHTHTLVLWDDDDGDGFQNVKHFSHRLVRLVSAAPGGRSLIVLLFHCSCRGGMRRRIFKIGSDGYNDYHDNGDL